MFSVQYYQVWSGSGQDRLDLDYSEVLGYDLTLTVALNFDSAALASGLEVGEGGIKNLREKRGEEDKYFGEL